MDFCAVLRACLAKLDNWDALNQLILLAAYQQKMVFNNIILTYVAQS